MMVDSNRKRIRNVYLSELSFCLSELLTTIHDERKTPFTSLTPLIQNMKYI